MTTPRIFQISISPGGVPKHPVHEGQVTEFGLVGDAHTDLKNHGGQDKALCLFSLERLQALQAAGHPIFPGSTGENLILSGLAWDEMQPGVRLRLGAEVCLEITSYTAPCHKIKESFAGGAFMEMSQKEHPGMARVYAKVLTPGTVRIGDVVAVRQIGTLRERSMDKIEC